MTRVTTLRNRQPDDWRKRTSHAPQSVHQALQDGLLRVVSAVAHVKPIFYTSAVI